MRLSTGREFYANRNIVGIDRDGAVYEGFDGGVDGANLDGLAPEDKQDLWTTADRLALADEMISRWQAFRDAASAGRKS